ncbi:MAG: hypothetical protein A2Z25_00115 [Planctomycetes bacterium RBG_16_55_9]|nr:MAG: hypothetical protein A2Z25_00115 [Planctomycetes bacterium RBG_16_55_9]
MKIKTLISGCLVGIIVLFLAREFGQAQALSSPPALNIAIVEIGKALQNCQATMKFKERMTAEDNEMQKEEDGLSEQIKSLRGVLQALVPNSNDYFVRSKEMMQKQKALEGLQDYNRQLKGLKIHQWTEKIYPEILRVTKELAAKKGLALVLAVEEPEFPTPRPEVLSAAIQTHKVLYSGGCSNLTSEVIAELDKLDFLLKD